MKRMPQQTAQVLARDLLGCGDPHELVTWAVAALVNGLDSPALRVLAGMDLGGRPDELNRFDASAEFRNALTQLDMALPGLDETLRSYLRYLINGMVDGEFEPQAVVETIHSEVLVPLRHPTDLLAWCFLWEGVEPETHRDIEGTELDEAIRRTAQSWMEERDV